MSGSETSSAQRDPSGGMVEFPSNGSTGSGYFAPAVGGPGPGVIVIQEWWGLVPHIRDVVDRFAAAGFSAIAPDLYRGTTTSEPDEAGKLMMSLNLSQAAKDLSGAISFLKESEAVSSTGVGVVGFCMGGGLAMMLAAREPDDVAACVPFYGLIPWEGAEPDWSAMQASIRGHFAELDGFFGPEQARGLESRLRELGKDVEFVIHPGVDHAFFNDARPEVHDAEAAGSAWDATVEHLRATLG